jgi:hypothetical protein
MDAEMKRDFDHMIGQTAIGLESVLITPNQTRALEYDKQTAVWILHIADPDGEYRQSITCESMSEMRDVLDLCDMVDQMYSAVAVPVPRCSEEAR